MTGDGGVTVPKARLGMAALGLALTSLLSACSGSSAPDGCTDATRAAATFDTAENGVPAGTLNDAGLAAALKTTADLATAAGVADGALKMHGDAAAVNALDARTYALKGGGGDYLAADISTLRDELDALKAACK